MLARLPLAGLGLACIVLGLLLALWLHQTPGETTQPSAQAPAPKEKSGRIPADTDGDVPIKGKCEPDGNPEWGEDWIGRYQWKNVRDDSGEVKEVQGSIHLNLCRMENLSYTREEKLGVIRHERAHSEGWDHGEGTPDTNAAFHDDYDFDR